MISKETVTKLVEMANTAPSGDNCQPWDYIWDGEVLFIRHLENRGRHAFNADHSASLIALGCVLESLDIAASALGIFTESEIEIERGIKAWVRLRQGTRPVDSLSQGLELRHTNRERFEGAHPDWASCLSEIRTWERGLPGVQLDFAEPSTDFTRFLGRMENIVWEEEHIHQDLHQWFRFGGGDRDGLPWRSLGVDYLSSRVLKWSRRFSRQRILNRLGFLAGIRHNTRKLVESGQGVVCLSISGTDRAHLVSVGRLGLRFWVKLNQTGMGVQPLTASSLLTYFARREISPPLKAKARQETALGLAKFQQQFQLPPSLVPVWLFRVGKAAPLPRSKRSNRLPVSKILRFEQSIPRAKTVKG